MQLIFFLIPQYVHLHLIFICHEKTKLKSLVYYKSIHFEEIRKLLFEDKNVDISVIKDAKSVEKLVK
jgi:hypothetical protein